MRKIIVCILLLGWSTSSQCRAGEEAIKLRKLIPSSGSFVMEEVAPKELAELRKHAENGLDETTVQALLSLATRCKELMHDQKATRADRGKAAEAYASSWGVAVVCRQKAVDPAVKQSLLKAWDQSLAEDDNTVFQIGALEFDWDSEFLTQKFWDLFSKTENKHIITAVARVVAKHGSPSDAEQLRKKKEELQRASKPGMGIQNALNYWGYWRGGDTNNPGPAALFPPPSHYPLE